MQKPPVPKQITTNNVGYLIAYFKQSLENQFSLIGSHNNMNHEVANKRYLDVILYSSCLGYGRCTE